MEMTLELLEKIEAGEKLGTIEVYRDEHTYQAYRPWKQIYQTSMGNYSRDSIVTIVLNALSCGQKVLINDSYELGWGKLF